MSSATFTDWRAEDGRELVEGALSWTATGESLQVALIQIEPERSFAPHSHPHEQFCVVLSGVFEFDVEGVGTRALGPQGVLHFASHQQHGGRVVGDEPVTMLEAFHPVRMDYTPGADSDHDQPG